MSESDPDQVGGRTGWGPTTAFVVARLAATYGLLLLNGWAVSLFWGWFVVPSFGWPPLGYGPATGLVLMLELVRLILQPDPRSDEVDSAMRKEAARSEWQQFAGARTSLLVTAARALAVLATVGWGWVVARLTS